MQFEFKRSERTFSAAEVAQITGVSQTMQRDWRRHGYIDPSEPGRRARFTLLEVCWLALMKAQTDVGKPLKGAHTLAIMSAGALLHAIERHPWAIHFDGIDLTSSQRIAFLALDEAYTKYIFFPDPSRVPNPLTSSEDPMSSAYHLFSLSEIEERVPNAWRQGFLFNIDAFAYDLLISASGPVVTLSLAGEGE